MNDLLKQIIVGGAIASCKNNGIKIDTPKGYENSETIFNAASEGRLTLENNGEQQNNKH